MERQNWVSKRQTSPKRQSECWISEEGTAGKHSGTSLTFPLWREGHLNITSVKPTQILINSAATWGTKILVWVPCVFYEELPEARSIDRTGLIAEKRNAGALLLWLSSSWLTNLMRAILLSFYDKDSWRSEDHWDTQNPFTMIRQQRRCYKEFSGSFKHVSHCHYGVLCVEFWRKWL